MSKVILKGYIQVLENELDAILNELENHKWVYSLPLVDLKSTRDEAFCAFKSLSLLSD